MVRKFLNRLIGRKDLSIDAVNAFVEGNASADEIHLVENLMQDNPSLERDLSTQQALRSVLGRIEKIEAPRSFAVTPEMVAAAGGNDSLLSRVAELFAPQRRLALAPAAIGVIAAVGVALLTIGDVTGIVDQSRSSGSEALSAVTNSESAAGGGASSPSGFDSSAEMVITEKGDSVAATAAPAATAAMGAPAMAAAAPELDSADDSTEEAPVAGLVGPDAGSAEPEPPSIMMEASDDVLIPEPDDSSSSAGTSDASEDSEIAGLQKQAETVDTSEFEIAKSSDSDDAVARVEGEDRAEDDVDYPVENPELLYETSGGPGLQASPNNALSLPIRQIQLALAALAVAAIGAWAALRRTHGG